MIHLDFETRGRANLKDCGAWNYAADDWTEILCMSWSVDGGDVITWAPQPGAGVWSLAPVLPCGFDVSQPVAAWNAFFELAIWDIICVARWGWPRVEQWVDVMAIATSKGLPGSLEKCAEYLGGAKKDKSGAALMRKMCAPNAAGKYFWTPDAQRQLEEYNRADVVAEREIYQALGSWSAGEMEMQQIDLAINRRGISVDVPAVVHACARVGELQARVNAEMQDATNGVVSTVGQVGMLKSWCASRGVHLSGCGADEIAETLQRADLPDAVRTALEARDTGAGAALKKYQAILDRVDLWDNRLRGEFVFNGTITGRWSSRGVQLQNLPSRGLAIKAEADLDAAVMRLQSGERDVAPGIPMARALKSLVRSMFCASEGRALLVADYASIEARIVLWLADEREACALFEQGADLYKEAASHIYGVPVAAVTKEQRAVGKETILGCGYGMGAAKFAARTGTRAAVADAAVRGYREKFAGVPALWRAAESVFSDVMYGRAPDRRNAEKLRWKYRRDKVGTHEAIICELPCGREITYLHPQIDGDDRLSVECFTPSGAPYRANIWGGDLVQNVVSGMAASVLRDALRRLDAAGYAVIATVHDEIIVETAYATQAALDNMIRLMTERAPWCGAPIAAEGWIGTRYRK